MFAFMVQIGKGQSNQILFNAELQAATVDVKDEQFRSAIRHLDNAKTFLGKDSTTSYIQYAYVKSYIGLGYFDDARNALKVYFEIANESDLWYVEMLSTLSKLDELEEKSLAQKEAEKQFKEEEAKEWIAALNLNTIQSYENYLIKFPASENASLANAKIKNLKLEEEIGVQKDLAEFYRKKWKSKKAWKIVTGSLLGAPCLLIGGAAGIHLVVEGGLEVEAYFIIPGFIILGSTPFLFIRPSKSKKKYFEQLRIIEEMERGLVGVDIDKTPNSYYSIGASSNGLGLSFKYNF